ncbi:MAG: RsmG family class I SAM-dependent methyltransferase [bacterium]
MERRRRRRPWENRRVITAPVPLEAIVAVGNALGEPLTEAEIGTLAAYLETLAFFNARLNLTALKDPFARAAELIGDSLLVCKLLADYPVGQAIDIGSGNGAPGIPFAIRNPGWSVELLERKTSVALYLEDAVRAARLSNTTVLNINLDQYAFREAQRPFVLFSKAVFPVEQFCKILADIAPPDVWGLWWGTPGLDAARLPDPWRILTHREATLPVTERPSAVYCLTRQ